MTMRFRTDVFEPPYLKTLFAYAHYTLDSQATRVPDVLQGGSKSDNNSAFRDKEMPTVLMHVAVTLPMRRRLARGMQP